MHPVEQLIKAREALNQKVESFFKSGAIEIPHDRRAQAPSLAALSEYYSNNDKKVPDTTYVYFAAKRRPYFYSNLLRGVIIPCTVENLDKVYEAYRITAKHPHISDYNFWNEIAGTGKPLTDQSAPAYRTRNYDQSLIYIRDKAMLKHMGFDIHRPMPSVDNLKRGYRAKLPEADSIDSLQFADFPLSQNLLTIFKVRSLVYVGQLKHYPQKFIAALLSPQVAAELRGFTTFLGREMSETGTGTAHEAPVHAAATAKSAKKYRRNNADAIKALTNDLRLGYYRDVVRHDSQLLKRVGMKTLVAYEDLLAGRVSAAKPKAPRGRPKKSVHEAAPK